MGRPRDGRPCTSLSELPDPTSPRGAAAEPYSAPDIAAALSAVVDAVLGSDCTLVFGGHPTITPLALFGAAEIGSKGQIRVYQSRYFKHSVTHETIRLAGDGYGEIIWTRSKRDDLGSSVAIMRSQMFREPFVAACFVGGMGGIEVERELYAAVHTGPHVLYMAPGGYPGRLAERLAIKVSAADRELGSFVSDPAVSAGLAVMGRDCSVLTRRLMCTVRTEG